MNVMKRAWVIAREGQKKFGGKVKDYFAEALRMAWKDAKASERVTIELRRPNSKQKTWVAKIVGKHPVYKFERKFVNPVAFGETTWELEAGVYEVCSNGNRYFIRVAGGEWHRIDAKDVA